MLELIINNKQVKLPQDCEVVVNISNPIFQDREENTYPFTVSLSANRHIWGYIDRFTSNEFQAMNAVLKCGRFDIVGNAYVSGISGDDIEIFISTDKKSFWGKAADLYLDALQFTPLKLSYNWDVYFKEAIEKDNVDYVLGEITVKEESCNNWNTDKEKFTGDDFILFPRLSSVLIKLISHLKYEFETDVLEYLKTIIFINRNKITPPGNYYMNNCLPHIKVDEFLKDLEKRFNLCFLVNERDKKIKLTSKYTIFSNAPGEIECDDNIRKTVEEMNLGLIKYSSASIDDEALGNDTHDIRIGYGTDDQEISLISATFGEKRNWYTEYFHETVDDKAVKGKASYDIPFISINSEDKDKIELRYGKWNGLVDEEIGGEAIPDNDDNMNEEINNEDSKTDDDNIPTKGHGWVVVRTIKRPSISPLYIYSSLLMNWNYDRDLLNDILKKINSNIEINFSVAAPNTIYDPFRLFKNTSIIRGQKCGIKTQEINIGLDGVSSHNMTVVPL